MVRQWQIIAFALLGAISGVLLLSITEVWTYILFSLSIGLNRRFPSFSGFFNMWVTNWKFSSMYAPIVVTGCILGFASAWSALLNTVHPRRIGQICRVAAQFSLLFLVPWRLYMFFYFFKRARAGVLGDMRVVWLMLILYFVLDPALIWAVALWRHGVLLQRKAMKDANAGQ